MNKPPHLLDCWYGLAETLQTIMRRRFGERSR